MRIGMTTTKRCEVLIKKEEGGGTVGLQMDFCDTLRHSEHNFSLRGHFGNFGQGIIMVKHVFQDDHSGSSKMNRFERNKSYM